MFKIMPMSGFEPGISGVGSDRSANCATTTALGMQYAPVDSATYQRVVDPELLTYLARVP